MSFLEKKMNFYKQNSLIQDSTDLFFHEDDDCFKPSYLDNSTAEMQFEQFDFCFEKSNANMYMTFPKVQEVESPAGNKASMCSSSYENASTHNDASIESQNCEKSEFEYVTVDENTDLNKLVEELIFTEAQESSFECKTVTPASSKSKRMWKRDGAKNTLESEYQKCKDWSNVEFRGELGTRVGYTAHQVYKWWAYRLTKDGMKVSSFSRKHK